MARDGEAVQAGLAAAVAAAVRGERLNVSQVCQQLNISRPTFYKYKKRFAAEGVEGFFPRSRRPTASRTVVTPELEEAIVRTHKELVDAGLDAGAWSVRARLTRKLGEGSVPSRSTVHRVLDRRGMVKPTPRRRPLRNRRRFEASAANSMWQMDGFETKLADGTSAVVIHVLDDHSRMGLAAHAARSENGEAAWAAFSSAADRHGLPARLLTDNGTAFSGARRGWTSGLEANVRALGVQPIVASVNHPQTCGKVERAHQTAQRWLAARPLPADLEELQGLVDDYREVYNHDRPHQGLDGLTPAERWAIAPKAAPAGHPIGEPTHVTHNPVSPAGCISVRSTEVGVGRTYARATAVVFRTGDHVVIFIGGRVVRELILDRTRTYQPQNP